MIGRWTRRMVGWMCESSTVRAIFVGGTAGLVVLLVFGSVGAIAATSKQAFQPHATQWAMVQTDDNGQAQALLAQGWEPFAVTPYVIRAGRGYATDMPQTYFFRKRVDRP